MNEMIERVVETLDKFDLDSASGIYADEIRNAARAVIEAMREPTEEMLKAEGIQCNCPMCGGHLEGWHLMIDAALDSPPQP